MYRYPEYRPCMMPGKRKCRITPHWARRATEEIQHAAAAAGLLLCLTACLTPSGSSSRVRRHSSIIRCAFAVRRYDKNDDDKLGDRELEQLTKDLVATKFFPVVNELVSGLSTAVAPSQLTLSMCAVLV